MAKLIEGKRTSWLLKLVNQLTSAKTTAEREHLAKLGYHVSIISGDEIHKRAIKNAELVARSLGFTRFAIVTNRGYGWSLKQEINDG